MWTDLKVNSAMGLQATAATKRKHEITFDSKDVNAYTNCQPPVKSSRWSTNRNNNNNDKDAVKESSLANKMSTVPMPGSDNSIAKLEAVAAVPCEPWNNAEPVDCISKLQAVAVPSDPWGSISTRSTLATTLLSADELDDDDDDFEDDYEEEESIIPTYCPIRYHPCSPPSVNQRNYSPGNGYNNRPNYYSEPYPQQNCSRTGGQHLRMNVNNNGSGVNAGTFNQWNHLNGSNSFYVPPEASYPSQQTIRCAENGKSYLELGCSNSTFNLNRINNSNGINNSTDARHPLKRCCDGRGGTWCNTSKNCYKDTRLKIRNLSMFKLSRFRQVSEQSLYRSVLICNTLKYIDKEIETEAKELLHHQQQQQQQQQQQHQQLQQHSLLHSHTSSHHHSHQHTHQQQQQQQQQQQTHQTSTDYSPAMGCARISGLEYQQHHQNQFHSNSADNRGDCSQNSYSEINMMNSCNKPSAIATAFNSSQSQQQQCINDPLHPYDHYPFREMNSGRATPFPTTPTLNDTDSGFGDDENNRSINWSSVLSLSSQSALDPLNNNDLFSILPSTTSVTSSNATPASSTSNATPSAVVAISGTFTTSSITTNSNNGQNLQSTPTTIPQSASQQQQSSGTTITQLTKGTTSSSSTSSSPLLSSLSSSAVSTSSPSLTSLTTISSLSASLSSASTTSPTWEYGFFDMDFGLGSEFTELMPSCKLSSDDLFKSVSPVSTSRYSSVHENELDHPAHIMVGS